MKPHQYKAFVRAQKTAQKVLSDQNYADAVLEQAHRKQLQNKKRLSSIWMDFQALQRLLAHSRQVERPNHIPKTKLILAFAAIIYFLNPFDLIPDFVPLGGFVDDVALISWVLLQIRSYLKPYRESPESPNTSNTSDDSGDTTGSTPGASFGSGDRSTKETPNSSAA